MITIRQRRQRLSATLSQSCGQPIRAIATATSIPKSSVHRHQQALKQRQRHPESPFWDTGAGDDWLKRLVVGAIYIFGIKRGVGAIRDKLRPEPFCQGLFIDAGYANV